MTPQQERKLEELVKGYAGEAAKSDLAELWAMRNLMAYVSELNDEAHRRGRRHAALREVESELMEADL